MASFLATEGADMRTPKDSELEAAHDYRAQQQEKFQSSDSPRVKLTHQQLGAAVAFIKQQFPETPLPGLRKDFAKAMVTKVGPYDEALSHSAIKSSALEVEQVLSSLQFPLRSGVSVGILHGKDLEAMQMPVMATQASVVLLTSHLTTVIYRLAKLLARTINISPSVEGVSELSWAPESVMSSLVANTEVYRDWGMFFLDCCQNPSSPALGRAITTSKLEHLLLCDLEEAMTWFVLAHEYGHHVLEHSLEGKAQAGGEDAEVSQSKEYEADALAVVVCMILGQNNSRGYNHCAFTNAGAILILSVLDFIKRGHQILLSGSEDGYQKDHSHPTLANRLATVAGITHAFLMDHIPEDTGFHENLLQQQADISRLIELIWLQKRDFLIYAYNRGERAVTQPAEWLPN